MSLIQPDENENGPGGSPDQNFVYTANVPQKINNPSRENSPAGEANTLLIEQVVACNMVLKQLEGAESDNASLDTLSLVR